MKPHTVFVDGPVGRIETLVFAADEAPRGIALIGHPHSLHGGSNTNKVAQTLARTFAGLGYVALLPNFRGVGQTEGQFDEGVGEADDMLALAAYGRAQWGELPLALAGFSFGAYVQTRVRARLDAQGMLLVGTAVSRFEVGPVPADTLVIHGDDDEVVPFADVLAWAKPQQLGIVVLPGVGHFFHGRLQQLQTWVERLWRY